MENSCNNDEQLCVKVFNAFDGVVLMCDLRSGAVLEANRRACEMFGYTRDEMLARNAADLCAEEPLHAPGGPFSRLDAGSGAPYEFPWHVKSKAGESFWLEAIARRIAFEGRVLAAVTASYAAEHSLPAGNPEQRAGSVVSMNALAIELASAPSGTAIQEFVVKRLKAMTGAFAVSFCRYDPADRTLALSHLEMEPGILEKFNRILGMRMVGMRFPVSEDVYREITGTVMGTRKSLTEVTFGGIPPLAGAVLQKLIRADRFIGLAYVFEGELYGTTVIAMKTGTPDPSPELLKSFLYMTAVSLRRRRAEEALSAANEQIRRNLTEKQSILDNMTEALIIAEPGDPLIYHNKASLNLHGYEDIREVRRPLSDLSLRCQVCSLDGVPLTAESLPLNRALRGERFTDYEVLVRRPGVGGEFVACYTGTPILESDGRMLFALVTIRDVTVRKQAESLIREREEHYRALYENTPLGYQSLDAEGRFLTVNQAWLDALGYAREDVIGAWFGDFLKPEHAEQFRQVFPHFKSSGKARNEYEMLHKDGTHRLIAFEGRVGRDSRGEFKQTHCIMQDVTERRRMEEKLVQSQKMGAIGQLAGGIAHDFNNLLNVIIGFSDLVLSRCEPDGDTCRDVGEIKNAARKAALLTAQLLAFSRKQPLRQETVSLNTVVAGMEHMLRRLIGEDVELQIAPGTGLQNVFVDRGQQEQVILNLVINARDAMPHGGKLTVATENVLLDERNSWNIPDARPGEFVCLSVSDTGIGMSREVVQHIFEPFFTTKQFGKGTGLGLSVIYGIIKQQEGWVTVSSEPGRGSDFKVYLPARHEEEALVETQAPEPCQVTGAGERILLVEDEPEVLALVERLLLAKQYAVMKAASAEEALEIFQREQGRFDLLFTDSVLPGKTGIELARLVVSCNPAVKVLVTSGYLDEKACLSDIRERGYHFLPKPYETTDLLVAVRKALGRT